MHNVFSRVSRIRKSQFGVRRRTIQSVCSPENFIGIVRVLMRAFFPLPPSFYFSSFSLVSLLFFHSFVHSFFLVHSQANDTPPVFVPGTKRSRISESTTGTMLSTSDTGNEDDRDSDSGGELLADRPLGETSSPLESRSLPCFVVCRVPTRDRDFNAGTNG